MIQRGPMPVIGWTPNLRTRTIVNDIWRGVVRFLDGSSIGSAAYVDGTRRDGSLIKTPNGADAVVLMAPPLADQLDAALNENPSRETAVAILGAEAVSAIDARLRWVHSVAGGAWTSAGP